MSLKFVDIIAALIYHIKAVAKRDSERTLTAEQKNKKRIKKQAVNLFEELKAEFKKPVRKYEGSFKSRLNLRV